MVVSGGQILTLAAKNHQLHPRPSYLAGNAISSQHTLHTLLFCTVSYCIVFCTQCCTVVLWCTVVGRGEGVLHSLHNVLLCFVQVPLHCVLHCGVLVLRALVGRGEGVLPKYKHRSIVWAARTDPSEGQMATRPYQRKISWGSKNVFGLHRYLTPLVRNHRPARKYPSTKISKQYVDLPRCQGIRKEKHH